MQQVRSIILRKFNSLNSRLDFVLSHGKYGTLNRRRLVNGMEEYQHELFDIHARGQVGLREL